MIAAHVTQETHKKAIKKIYLLGQTCCVNFQHKMQDFVFVRFLIHTLFFIMFMLRQKITLQLQATNIVATILVSNAVVISFWVKHFTSNGVRLV